MLGLKLNHVSKRGYWKQRLGKTRTSQWYVLYEFSNMLQFNVDVKTDQMLGISGDYTYYTQANRVMHRPRLSFHDTPMALESEEQELLGSGWHFNIKMVMPGTGIPIIMIRRSWDRLIIMMGIPILANDILTTKQPQDDYTTTKPGTTKPCAYFLGHSAYTPGEWMRVLRVRVREPFTKPHLLLCTAPQSHPVPGNVNSMPAT